MKGILGDMFDFNHNGNLEPLEQAMELTFLTEMEKASLNDQLNSSGINPVEFEDMDSEDRTEKLTDAGLDPDEYEDYDIL